MAIQFAHTGRTGSMNDTAIDMGRYAHARAMLSFIDLLYPDTLLVVAEKETKERTVCFLVKGIISNRSISYPQPQAYDCCL